MWKEEEDIKLTIKNNKDANEEKNAEERTKRYWRKNEEGGRRGRRGHWRVATEVQAAGEDRDAHLKLEQMKGDAALSGQKSN
ncbi:hypothetical protein E2C01_101740 [Portunus trituberculatus]|uniref:Uncharacterized protein n=1 Tax=Portunus trituberculatus TaxID=210409 RepID=A0A5B7KMN1_PORTR|nr:hypothetical protein [Portunus trituberculatus]